MNVAQFRKSRSGVLLLALTLVSALTLLVAGCSTGPETSETYTFNVGEMAKLVVTADNTQVDIQAQPGGNITVQATLRRADDLTYELSQDGNTVTIDIDIEGAGFIGESPGAELDITVPPQTELDIRTSNGAVNGNGTHGIAKVETSNGKIEFKNASGDFDLRTSNGSLNLSDFSGQVDGETSNGRIEFEGNLTDGSENRLTTSNGRIDVEFDAEPNIDLDAETSNGDIDCDFPITATVTGDDRLVGTIGAGGTKLDLSTSNGDITIR